MGQEQCQEPASGFDFGEQSVIGRRYGRCLRGFKNVFCAAQGHRGKEGGQQFRSHPRCLSRRFLPNTFISTQFFKVQNIVPFFGFCAIWPT